MNLLESHTKELQQRCERVFSHELEREEPLSTQIPIIKWDCHESPPGACLLYLLSLSGLHRQARLFLEEMITQWLIPPAHLEIVSFKSLIFNHICYESPLTILEIVIPIKDQKTLENLKLQLPHFTGELKKGLSSVELANQILEAKRFSLSSRTNSIYEAIFALMRRHPKRFSHDLFREAQNFLLECSEGFRKLRDVRHLCRIICTQHLLQKKVQEETKWLPHRRHLAFKFLSAKVISALGIQRVFGLTLVMNRLSDFEIFELRHIMRAIQRFVPEAYAHTDSFHSHFNEESQLTTLYLEIQKKGAPFTLSEMKTLQTGLADALHENIEYLSPFLFIPRKEEDLVRSMAALCNEMKQLHDPPQVLISFQEQQRDSLKFQIILLRILRSDTPPITTLSECLPPNIRFLFDKSILVGTLRGRYPKEAVLFTFEMENRLFLRANHSVDLLKARQTVSQALEKMIGPFKDKSATFIPHPLSKDATKSDSKSRQRLRLHLPRAAQSLDPRIAMDRTSGIVIRMLYEGLCRVNPEGKIENALARDISVSEEGKKYLISLKETYWSNGSALTAYDFEYAWKKNLDPLVHSPYCFLFFCIQNGEAAKKGDLPLKEVGIEVIDDHTLCITLEYPAPYFKELLASWFFSPLCKEIDQKHPGWAYHVGATHVSNGPFKLDLWKLTDELQLVKNPLYWDAPTVKLDQINLAVIDDEQKSLDLFLKGELDWVGDPLSKITLKGIPYLQEQKMVVSDPQNYGLFWLQMNLQKAPFHNLKIRKALAWGTNRKKIIDEVLHSEGLPAFGFSSLKEKAFPASFNDGDEDRALSFFAAGLKELGLTRKELPTLVFSHSELEEHVAITYAIAEQWQSLFGFKVKYKKLLWNGYFESLFQKEHMIGGLVWYNRYKDPIYHYELFLPRPYALPITDWKHPHYDRFISLAQATAQTEERDHYLFQAEQLLLEAMPTIPLFYQHFRYVKNPLLKGEIISNMHQIDFRLAHLDKEAKR